MLRLYLISIQTSNVKYICYYLLDNNYKSEYWLLPTGNKAIDRSMGSYLL